jgi:queuine/archaeosine tRNA-ribosyltransferase
MGVVRPGVSIHLLGVIRWSHLDQFLRLGVTSFDSTSPLRQAFLDDSNNYYIPDGAVSAVRIPQMDANIRLKRRIQAGELDCSEVRLLEQRCLAALRDWGANSRPEALEPLLGDLDRYAAFLGGRKSLREANRHTLVTRPWSHCTCQVCRDLGIEVIMFRGANRNRRRGFHNLHVAYQRLQGALSTLHEAGMQEVRGS